MGGVASGHTTGGTKEQLPPRRGRGIRPWNKAIDFGPEMWLSQSLCLYFASELPILAFTMKPPIKDTPKEDNKGPLKEDNLSTKDKMAGPKGVLISLY